MKKLLLTAAIMFTIAGQAFAAMPQYTDELPDSYIKQYKESKKFDNKQALPIYNTEKGIEVKVYSPQKITLQPVAVKEGKVWDIKQQYNINDEIAFSVSEDVTKNGILYIKKGTTAVGIVRKATLNRSALTAPDELQISMFSTKDVNGKEVKLYGTILSEGKEYGIFTSNRIPTLRASIPKNKIYTLYAEK